ncbi:hypothetical protein HanHA89_Chr09g0322781 [Helianthus annuus]|nr:hypothetical protein HanHA89_Chr09g0322781 [Helianthus annuus]
MFDPFPIYVFFFLPAISKIHVYNRIISYAWVKMFEGSRTVIMTKIKTEEDENVFRRFYMIENKNCR